MTWKLIHADCLEAMAEMDEASVDAIVTDPPYGLEFMGKEWDAPWKDEARGKSATTVDPASVGGFQDGNGGNPYSRAAVRTDTRRHGGDMLTANRGYQDWSEAWATAALRVLKPGGHLLAFGGTRTYHRLACAVEDAGFEIRDCLAWMYGSGFPKSLDVSKAIDKAAGAEREVVGTKATQPGLHRSRSGANHFTDDEWQGDDEQAREITAPATPEAQRWQGWGTALKPAFEPIVLARKPLVGSVASNVQTYGTGALNIDAARVETDDDLNGGAYAENGGRQDLPGAERSDAAAGMLAPGKTAGRVYEQPVGRWPANVVLDPEAAALLDEQTGERPGATSFSRPKDYDATSYQVGDAPLQPGYGDTGGASRFFKVVEGSTQHGIADLSKSADTAGSGEGDGSAQSSALPSVSRFRYVPKADREERDRGLEHRRVQIVDVDAGHHSRRMEATERFDGAPPAVGRNNHPTVKPVELMRWLCKLVTPPGGLILDPFTGSGSTGIAALREGFDFVGIEREADYVEIARDRIIGDAPLFNVAAEVS